MLLIASFPKQVPYYFFVLQMGRIVDAYLNVSLVPDYAIDVGSRRIVRFDLVDRTADGAIVAMATSVTP